MIAALCLPANRSPGTLLLTGSSRSVTKPSATAKPVPKTYVKVYAQLAGGQVRFYKDGYTDLRGRFDYSSLNTSELDQVKKFAILILSPEHGSIIQEVSPPQR